MDKNEELLRHIARSYAERYGRELEEERAGLEHEGAEYDTRRLERHVLKSTTRRRRAQLMGLAAAAACLALIFISTRLFAPDIGDIGADSTGDAISDSMGDASHGDGYEAIALRFSVPEGFTQTGFEQDREKSVYRFEDKYKDDVVMTLERASAVPDTAGLTRVGINSSDAYAASEEGYSLLTFEKDGVLYVMTCLYDVNTLVRFAEAIL